LHYSSGFHGGIIGNGEQFAPDFAFAKVPTLVQDGGLSFPLSCHLTFFTSQLLSCHGEPLYAIDSWERHTLGQWRVQREVWDFAHSQGNINALAHSNQGRNKFCAHLFE